jgi:hypothetical protein
MPQNPFSGAVDRAIRMLKGENPETLQNASAPAAPAGPAAAVNRNPNAGRDINLPAMPTDPMARAALMAKIEALKKNGYSPELATSLALKQSPGG